jgi:hypothetical protein
MNLLSLSHQEVDRSCITAQLVHYFFRFGVLRSSLGPQKTNCRGRDDHR